MSRCCAILLLLIICCSCYGQQRCVKFKASNAQLMKKIQSQSLPINVKQCYPNAKTKELLQYYKVVGGNNDDAIKSLKANGASEIVFDSVVAYPTLAFTNDTWLAEGWCNNFALELVNAKDAWTISKGRPDIYIGIADTDFETTHDDLKNQIVFIDGPISDKHFHGTEVAGVAGAETNNGKGVAGIGYNCKLKCWRIKHKVDKSGGCTAESVNIQDAVWNLYLKGVPIINVSWSSTGLNRQAAEEITSNGTVLVVAAGNKPNAMHNSDIADIPGVIVVSSVDSQNQHGPTGHAHNKYVDICAVGTAVSTTKINNTYGSDWGTSLAAPMVSGIIALMLDVNPTLTPALIEQTLKQTADPIADAAKYPNGVGAGRVNAHKAVMAAGTRSFTNTTFSGIKNLSAGYCFNLKNVTIAKNSKINLTARKEVIIEGPFEVPLGSELSININETARSN